MASTCRSRVDDGWSDGAARVDLVVGRVEVVVGRVEVVIVVGRVEVVVVVGRVEVVVGRVEVVVGSVGVEVGRVALAARGGGPARRTPRSTLAAATPDPGEWKTAGLIVSQAMAAMERAAKRQDAMRATGSLPEARAGRR